MRDSLPLTGAGSGRTRRIVWLIDALKPGGAEHLALRCAALAPPPWRIELWALQPPPGDIPLAQLWGEEWDALARGEDPRVRQLHIRRLTDAAAWLWLYTAWRRQPPSLVHTHLRYATIWGGSAAHWLKLPWLTTVHLLPGEEPSRRQRWAAALERALRRRARRVIYLSLAQQAAWAPAPQRERATLLGNGVAIPTPAADRAAQRRVRGWTAADCVFLTVAVVRPRKGWRCWLDAVARVAPQCPNARFVWVGGGPEFTAFEAAVHQSPAADRIQLAGPSTSVQAWLACADVFVFPSEEEAQPTALLEAMAAGLPVIASALPAIEEVLNGCARLVPPGNAAALASAIASWGVGAGAAAERQIAGMSARRHAAARYGEVAWMRGLLSLYEEVLDGARGTDDRRTAAGLAD